MLNSKNLKPLITEVIGSEKYATGRNRARVSKRKISSKTEALEIISRPLSG